MRRLLLNNNSIVVLLRTIVVTVVVVGWRIVVVVAVAVAVSKEIDNSLRNSLRLMAKVLLVEAIQVALNGGQVATWGRYLQLLEEQVVVLGVDGNEDAVVKTAARQFERPW